MAVKLTKLNFTESKLVKLPNKRQALYSIKFILRSLTPSLEMYGPVIRRISSGFLGTRLFG